MKQHARWTNRCRQIWYSGDQSRIDHLQWHQFDLLTDCFMRSITPTIFKAYDIRGIVGKTVDA
ncbi:hypothetical protein, partial [Pandoraea nosoerga]|uniref:hypothetical protein n=1 Tax=Pandoraea nosoerga TaxID=2508296 RepID=UPI00197D3F3F